MQHPKMPIKRRSKMEDLLSIGMGLICLGILILMIKIDKKKR